MINIKTKKSSQQALEGRIGARIGSFGTFGQNMSAQGKSINGIINFLVLMKNQTEFRQLLEKISIKMALKSKMQMLL